MKILFFLIFFNSIFSNQISYDESFRDYSNKSCSPVAVLVVAFNRPRYLKETIASIEKNKESKDLPFFFFLDGGPKAKQEELIRVINDSSIDKKHIILREKNYGIPKNHIDAKRFMFDFCGFEKVVIFEEDIVVSSNYFETLFKLDDWAEKNYKNIGTVQIWADGCLLSFEEKKKNLKKIRETSPSWSFVTYLMHQKVWKNIASILYEYEREFIDPFLQNPSEDMARSKPTLGPLAKEITHWAALKLIEYKRRKNFLRPRSDKKILQTKISYFEEISSIGNQDTTTAFALWLKGYTRLQTVVNRAIHIGQDGFLTKGYPIYLAMRLDEINEELCLNQYHF